jgi:hypothetical protein
MHLAAENDHASTVKVLLKAPVDIVKLLNAYVSIAQTFLY